MLKGTNQNHQEMDYFNELLKKNNGQFTIQQHQINHLLQASIEKIQKQINVGDVKIEDKDKYNNQMKKIKKEKHKKQIELLNKEIFKNQEQYKEAKRQLIKQKREENQIEKEEHQMKKKEIQEKVRKWTELQRVIKRKHQISESERIKGDEEQNEKMKRQEEEQIAFHKLEKQKQIEQKLKKIQESKMKRQQMIKNSIVQTQNLNPKFIEIEKQFKQHEEEHSFEQKIQKKNHKLAMKFDHNALKAHEKAYMEKVQERITINQPSPKTAHNERSKEQFNIFLNRNQDKNIEELKKLKRRKQFQEKIKEIPITIDDAKKVEVEIAIDKSKNPLKYNFLGQKALNEFQIYGEFKQFNINVNPKELGVEYLKELPNLTKNSRIQKSQSVHTITHTSNNNLTERIKYKDYLQELKEQRPHKNNQEIQEIIKNHKQKEKAIIQLSEQSKKYEEEAKKKMQEIEKFHKGFHNQVKKSKQVDDMYVKSIRAKLACLEIN